MVGAGRPEDIVDAETRSVRALGAGEVETLVGWAAGEGWNPGLRDATALRAADPDGFIGAFVDGEMVAGISAVAYGHSYGFVGLYICRPDRRGQGHGKAVWDAGMARLAGRTVGLDGVDAQFENYRSKGFEPAYRTVRFGGRLRGAGIRPDVVPMTEALAAEVTALDEGIFPAPRREFLKAWLAPPHRIAALRSGNAVAGYAVLRQCREGWKAGGVMASSAADAFALLSRVAEGLGDDIYIDVPAYQQAFIADLRAAGLTPGFETTRMYRGPAPGKPSPQLFGVTTLELG